MLSIPLWHIAEGGIARVAKKCNLLFGDFSCQVGIHAVADFGLVQSVPQEEHEFGDCTFGGAVIAADDACLEKVKSGFVASHLDGAALALGDVDDDNAAFAGFFQLADEPFFLGGIAGTEGLEDNSFQTSIKRMIICRL